MDKEQEEEGAKYSIFLNMEVVEDTEVVELDNTLVDRLEDKEEEVQDKAVEVYDRVEDNDVQVYVQDSVYLQKYEYFYEAYIYIWVYD